MRNDTNRPTSLSDLLVTLTLLALQGFGGVLAVVQHELVERKRWLTREEFVEEWAVAQIMPGPNVINLRKQGTDHYYLRSGNSRGERGYLCVSV